MTQLMSILVLAFLIVDVHTPAARRQATQRITVIGCVKRSQPDTAATGTTILSPGQPRYVLVNVTLAGNTAQTETAEQVAAAVPMYRLEDSSDGIIATHVGEKVEVSGTIVPGPTSPSASPPEGQRVPDATASQAAAPVLRVEELRSISKTADACH